MSKVDWFTSNQE